MLYLGKATAATRAAQPSPNLFNLCSPWPSMGNQEDRSVTGIMERDVCVVAPEAVGKGRVGEEGWGGGGGGGGGVVPVLHAQLGRFIAVKTTFCILG